MKSIKYPPKPWKDGQVEKLLSGIDFMYNAALRNWVPISPGYTSEKQLTENFDVKTIAQLNEKFKQIEVDRISIDSDIQLTGRIWKTVGKPPSPRKNDIWIDYETAKTFSYFDETNAWVELNFVQQ